MPKRDYLFIDESGDIGSGEGDSSKYYAELVFHITDDSIPHITKHIVNWRYIRGFNREMKGLGKKSDIGIFLSPLSEMKNQNLISCSAIYLVKNNYTGPYLKSSSPRGEDPISFRNFVHRQLLEFHFSRYRPSTNNIELVFDRFEMTSEAMKNLEDYLKGNINLPDFKHITHADSLYTDFLQIASQLVNSIRDIALNETSEVQDNLCEFISLKDITYIHK